MSISNIARTVLAAFVALAFSSCIEMEQDIWIGKDGGGTAILKMGISNQMLQMAAGFGDGGGDSSDPFDIAELKKKLAENPNVISSEVREEQSDAFKYVIVELEVKDITKITEVQDDMMADGPAGQGSDGSEFKIEKTEGGTYKVSANLSPPEGADLGPGAEMIKGMIGDAKMVFRVHAKPVSADSHNGTVEEDAIVWSVPLADVISGKASSITGEFLAGGGRAGGGMVFWLVLGSVAILAVVLFFVFRAQKPRLV